MRTSSRTAIHTVKPDNIATFLGKKLAPQFEGEMGNRFNVRIEGTRIKHTMGPVSLKLYDKFGLILRIETTVNDLTFFKHYREVEQRICPGFYTGFARTDSSKRRATATSTT